MRAPQASRSPSPTPPSWETYPGAASQELRHLLHGAGAGSDGVVSLLLRRVPEGDSGEQGGRKGRWGAGEMAEAGRSRKGAMPRGQQTRGGAKRGQKTTNRRKQTGRSGHRGRRMDRPRVRPKRGQRQTQRKQRAEQKAEGTGKGGHGDSGSRTPMWRHQTRVCHRQEPHHLHGHRRRPLACWVSTCTPHPLKRPQPQALPVERPPESALSGNREWDLRGSVGPRTRSAISTGPG